jgi:hypothetical protein
VKGLRQRHILSSLAMLALVALTLRYLHYKDPQRQLTECKSNLKNLGTAMEMYSTDWSGHYPNRLLKLVPNYLDALPTCPTCEAMTYQMEYGPEASHNEAGFHDYYYLYCEGHNHSRAGVPENIPAYDGIVSTHER